MGNFSGYMPGVRVVIQIIPFKWEIVLWALNSTYGDLEQALAKNIHKGLNNKYFMYRGDSVAVQLSLLQWC